MCGDRALPGVGSGVGGTRGAPGPLLARNVVMSKDHIGEKYQQCAWHTSDLASLCRLGSAERIVFLANVCVTFRDSCRELSADLLIFPPRANNFRSMCRSEQLEQTET